MVVVWNKHIKELTWLVVGDSMEKTRIVMVKSVRVHPLYKKRFVVRKKYYVHDENNTSKLGDEVKIIEAKPISRLKRWSLVGVL